MWSDIGVERGRDSRHKPAQQVIQGPWKNSQPRMAPTLTMHYNKDRVRRGLAFFCR